MAKDACDIEIEKLNEPIGKQDQYAAAFGGLNIFRFSSSGSVDVERIHLQREIYKTLQNNLLMFYTGQQRSASSILSEQKENMQAKVNFQILCDMVGLVDELRDVLYAGNLREFGTILHKGWLAKQKLASKISSPQINDIYALALKGGAVGGKVLGAGGGGFLLLYCEKEQQTKLRATLSEFRELKFKLENDGSKLIHADDEY